MIACRRGLEFASARYVYLVDVLCGSRSSRPLVPLASAFLHAGRHDIDGVEMRFDTGFFGPGFGRRKGASQVRQRGGYKH